MEFIIGVIVGAGIGVFLSELFDSKDKKIKYYRKAMKICDNTIETLSEEKASLQDEVKELKEYRDAINSHLNDSISESLIKSHNKIEIKPVKKLDLQKEGFIQ